MVPSRDTWMIIGSTFLRFLQFARSLRILRILIYPNFWTCLILLLTTFGYPKLSHQIKRKRFFSDCFQLHKVCIPSFLIFTRTLYLFLLNHSKLKFETLFSININILTQNRYFSSAFVYFLPSVCQYKLY